MKTKTLSLLLIALFLLVGCGTKESKMQSHLDKGKKFLQQSDLIKAGLEVRNVLQIDPKNADGYLLAAQIEESRSEFPKAYSAYQKAIELKPGFIAAMAGLAKIYLLVGDVNEAEKTIQQIEAIDANHIEGKALRAAFLAKTGHADEAMSIVKKSIINQQDLSVDVILLASGLYANQQNNQESLALLERGLKSEPKNIKLLEVAADVSNRLKQDSKVEEYYERAADIAPKNSDLWRQWSLYYVNQGKLDQAENVLRKSIKAESDDSDRYIILAQFLSAKRSKEVAETELKKIIDARPKDFAIRFTLAELYRETGRQADAIKVVETIKDLDKGGPSGLKAKNILAGNKLNQGDVKGALSLLNEVLVANPRDDSALMSRAQIAISQTRYKDAIDDLRAVLKDQRGSTKVISLLAQAHIANKEPQLARELVTDSVKLFPTNADIRYLAASYFASNNDRAQAIKEVDEVIKNLPGSVRAYEVKSAIQIQEKDFNGAEMTLKALKEQLPNSPIGYFRLGELYFSQKKPDLALAEFDNALKISPQAVDVLSSAVSLLVSQKKYKEAETRILAGQSKQPENPLYEQMLAELAVASDDVQLAEAKYESAISKDKRFTSSYLGLARLYSKKGNLDKAISVLDRGLEVNNQNHDLLSTKAEWLSRLGKYDLAITAYEELHQLYPDDQAAANNLAFLLSDMKGDPASLEKALDLTKNFADSTNPGFLDSLGWIYYKMGRYQDATPILRKAVEANGQSPILAYHLGLSLNKEGKQEEAKKYLKAVLASKADLPNLEEAKKIVQIN
ncbi:tetratricopeptide repeat protein [Ampullimonas aquatilis]|uniref:tetratricopeptide repeat protein n=1 Tax=Ampullimonas aquatilis TaxID=1341549 RepID=UPI003C73FBEE